MNLSRLLSSYEKEKKKPTVINNFMIKSQNRENHNEFQNAYLPVFKPN